MPHKELQKWFADVLRTPLQGQSIHYKHTKKAAEYIPATPLMQPHERLEIYNQQYWWRLFSALQHVLPSVSAYLGEEAFNRLIAEPYLLTYNVDCWALYYIGDRVLSWLTKQKNKDPLVLELAQLDMAFYSVFLKKVIEVPEIDPSKPFFLQPHVKPLYMEKDLLQVLWVSKT